MQNLCYNHSYSWKENSDIKQHSKQKKPFVWNIHIQILVKKNKTKSLNNVNLIFVIPKDFITLVLMEKEPGPFLLDMDKRDMGEGGGGEVSNCAFENFWIEVW